VRRDLGDFQTPPELACAVVATLGPIGSRFRRVLEPTCGRGHFIAALLGSPDPPREVLGIELQASHVAAARALPGARIERASIFDIDLRGRRGKGPLLAIGNPPWVTNAELGSLGSANLPGKKNLRRLPGMAARTGESNFDLALAIFWKLLSELDAPGEETTVALLVKTSVARAVLALARENALPVTGATLRKIDAKRWFGAAVDACFFAVTLGPGPVRHEARVHASLDASEPEAVLGFARGNLVDLSRYAPELDGSSTLTWRQGVKHDAAPVMELRDGKNRLGEAVDVEPEHVFPLLKGGALFRGEEPLDAVIVPQRKLGEDTRTLETRAPRLWRYLVDHRAHFEKRRSRIYEKAPPFAIFGIGPYSFAPWKVAVSGLHKEPRFRAIGPREGKPVFLDDTGYFLPCESGAEARALVALLAHEKCLAFLRSIVFLDAKRPITKKVLARIDLEALRRSGRNADRVT
jgi:hypothetical protein